MKILLLSAALLFSTLFLFSCKKDNPIPPEDQPQVNLFLEDVSCTEAWLKLTTANIGLPAEAALMQNDVVIQTISLGTTDTLLYVDSLLPNHSYKFQSVIQSVNKESGAINVTTMDTTSHNFTFETFTFGGTAGSSTLYDVAIIDENDIWAVGEIYVADTTQNGYTLYNAVHWNGNQWELKRIRYYGSCSAVEFPPLKAIWAFSDSDIIITNGGSIGWFDGTIVSLDCRVNLLLTGAINKIWGASKNDIYVVGNAGSIAHYQNGQWSRIESGTDANINDIWGVVASQANEGKILCSVPSGIEPSKRRILTINEDNIVDSIPCNGIIITSVWSNPGGIIYTSGWGIYSNKSGALEKESSIPDYYSNRIRGNKLSDIFVCGNYGFLAHYNGVSWKIYSEFAQLNSTLLTSISLKDDIFVIVGFRGEDALVILGERN